VKCVFGRSVCVCVPGSTPNRVFCGAARLDPLIDCLLRACPCSALGSSRKVQGAMEWQRGRCLICCFFFSPLHSQARFLTMFGVEVIMCCCRGTVGVLQLQL